MVVLSDPLLKRALSRREKHEVLFAAAILALGRNKSRKQHLVGACNPTKPPHSALCDLLSPAPAASAARSWLTPVQKARNCCIHQALMLR